MPDQIIAREAASGVVEVFAAGVVGGVRLERQVAELRLYDGVWRTHHREQASPGQPVMLGLPADAHRSLPEALEQFVPRRRGARSR